MRSRRMMGLFVFFLALFAQLSVRLYRVATDEQANYARAAVTQQQVEITLSSRKGLITDRSGLPLNYRIGTVAALVEPNRCESLEQTAMRLASACALTTAELLEQLQTGRVFGIELDRPIPETAGVTQLESVQRLTTPPAIHTVGTVSSLDGAGQSGIELAFEEVLDGMGGRLVASMGKTAAGRALPGSEVTLADQGYYEQGGVRLTLDAGMQKIMQRATADIGSGAAVLLEVQTGRIRALHSMPDYEGDRLADYLDSTGGELLNRVLQRYNIGSIFKILVTAQALEHDIAMPPYTCTGKITVEGRDFYCHNRDGHGTLTLHQAFAKSCNTFFIARLGEAGYDNTLALARALRWDAPLRFATGIAKQAAKLPGAHKSSGQLLANTAIGQGELLATPLDMAAAVAAVANGGTYYEPTLVEGLVDSAGTLLRDMTRTEGGARVFSEQTAAALRTMMAATCTEGTGTTAQPDGFAAGGKTASAETGWLQNGEEVVHGLFAGYFPAENPRYALVVLVENGKSGSLSAAPVFKQIAEGVMALEAGPAEADLEESLREEGGGSANNSDS